MAEVQSRGSGLRGRGGFRGGRGGFRGTRNPSRSQHKPDHDQENLPPAPLEDQGEVGELLKKFGDKVPLLKEICPGWSDEDLVYALNETDGDVNAAVDRISSGTISQWGEVKKKHPKPKEIPPASTDASTRGRGRGNFEGRGRGRGAERGARGGRGAKSVSAAHTNGTKPAQTTDGLDSATPAPADAAAVDTAPTNGDATATESWPNEPGKDSLTSLQTEEPKPASAAAPATAKPGGWAGLFAKPPPAPAPKKAPAPPPPAVAQPEQLPVEPEPVIEEPVPPTEPIAPPPIEAVDYNQEGPNELTEQNLEKLPDTSHPIESATAASTVASTQDPLAAPEASKTAARPVSGYAATALKATGGTSRSASFARKVMEQQEAVVMPGNHAIEKAAVQFGKLGLNGPDDIDVDEDREEPETRTQLPDDSPAAPRASLPPAVPEAQQTPAAAPTQPLAEASATAQRQAPGLPSAPQPAHEPSPQTSSAYAEQYRYGQGQKPFDPFGQPPTTQAQTQEPFSNQVPSQPSTATSQPDYSSYYGRDAYNYYGYGHGQDAQRSGSTFGTSAPDSQGQYATSRPQHGMGQQEAQGSGQNTPAPGIPGHPTQQPSGHMQQNQGHGYPGYGYPSAYNQQYPQYGANYMGSINHRYGVNRPMFDDVRRQENEYYGSQYNYGAQNHYGNTYKSNMYGQPQQGYSYEHSSSPANVSGFGREGGYGRAGSAQPSEAQQSAAGSTSFGGMPDPFGRSSSSFGQAQGLAQQHGAHSEDPAKPSGPSPSMQGGRPGSAVNSFPGQQQGGLPPPSQHSGQQAFGAYPQYGGGLGSGHQNTHQNTGYGGYGSNTGFGTYGGYGGGRGWNGSYGSGH
ncbi:CUE domain-containing protein isoform 2 [Cladophialophora immunda]|nr:CUE domain-containing protein isoform 2 [Cladophialophora immunda]